MSFNYVEGGLLSCIIVICVKGVEVVNLNYVLGGGGGGGGGYCQNCDVSKGVNLSRIMRQCYQNSVKGVQVIQA